MEEKKHELIAEIEDDLEEYDFGDIFSKVNVYTKDIQESQEKLLADQEIPDKKIAKKVSLTQIEVDLALVSLAKATSFKLLKLENFLSKIEDILYNEEVLRDLDKGRLIALYSQTRIMRSELLKSLQELKKSVDFDTLNAQIQALNIQDEKNEITSLDEIVEKILKNENFIENIIEINKEKVDEIKDS